MKNYVYVATCLDSRGWAAGCSEDEGVWGGISRAERIFGRASEAHALVRQTLGAGCWDLEQDDGEGNTIVLNDPPRLTVECRAVYEWLWSEDDDDATDRVVDLHGGPIRLDTMPPHVGRFLLNSYRAAGRRWSYESARLAGASSATHTAAIISAAWDERANEIRRSFSRRGIAI